MNLELMSRDAEAQHGRLGKLVETVDKLVGTVEKLA